MTRPILIATAAAVLACAGSTPPPRTAAAPARAGAAAQTSAGGGAAPAPARRGQATGGDETAGRAPAAAAQGGMPARAQRLFEEAVRADADQRKLGVPTDWAYLERKWRAVVDAAPVAEAHHNLGVALEAQGKLGEAREAYERARELKPSLRQPVVNLGVLLEKQGDPRAAAAVYAQCIRDFPEDGIARERLAALYLASGQLDDAWRLAREALVRERGSVGAYRVLARVALQRNDLDLAKLIALRAQKLDPRDPELPFVVGQVLARQGDEAGSQAQLRKALALRESFLPAHHALLASALKKQAWGSVREHTEAILKAEPGNAQLHLVHGIALRHTGKPDEALAAYDRAQKLGSDAIAEVHLARGVLFARVKSDCGRALEELKLYQERVGPVLPEGAQVVKLQRECEVMLEENRRAAEAAKAMQIEAQRQAAEKAARAANEKEQGSNAAPSQGRGPVAPQPNPAR